MTFRVLAPLERTLGITRIEDGQGRARERERKRRKKGALGKPNSGEEEKRGGRVHSQSRKKTGGGCCEKEGASFVVRRGREADVRVWIGQCRPLSISDSVPSTTQAGQSESELCRGTVTTFHLPAPRSRFGWRYGGSRPSPVPLSQADCFVSAASLLRLSVGRRLEFRSVPHPPVGCCWSQPRP